MKKIFFAAIAVVTMSLVSCNGGVTPTSDGVSADSVELVADTVSIDTVAVDSAAIE